MVPGNMIEFDDAHDARFAAKRIALDGDLNALEHALADQALAADALAGMALEHALQGQKELVECAPAGEQRRKLGARSNSFGADRKERFHRLHEQGKACLVGKRRALHRVDQREGRHGIRHQPGLRHPREIFVLADEHDARVGPR